MNELSLFTGAGGGVLGGLLLGWRTVGYVEWDEYCQRVIAQRIADGILHDAPIFGDIRAFIREGYADAYRGVAEIVTAGFPCQPFSVAGKRRGEGDERNMWPETIDVIRRVRPRFCLLENVAGLLVDEYVRRIFGDLAEAGYDADWTVLGADDVGAPHRRKRLWIVAHAQRDEHLGTKRRISTASQGIQEFDRKDDGSSRLSRGTGDLRLACQVDVADAERAGFVAQHFSKTGSIAGCRAWWLHDPADDPQSGMGRVAHGLAHRMDRLKSLGNGQVPAVVEAAWRLLIKRTWEES